MATVVHAPPPADGLESEPGGRVKGPAVVPRINAGFNVALFLFVNAMSVFRFLMTSQARPGVQASGLAVSIGLDLARYVVVLLVTAWFLRAFWERLVSSLFPVRPIDRQEAIAIVLMVAALFA